MASVRKGLTPYRVKGGGVYTGGQEKAVVSNGYATALGVGDPIYISAGIIRVAANTSLAAFLGVAGSAASLDNLLPNREYGVFMGCRYVNADGLVIDSTYFPANTSSKGGTLLEGYNQPIGFYVPARDHTFLAMASVSVSALEAGKLAPVEVSSPSAVFKRSTAKINPTVASAGLAHMVRIKGFPNIAGSKADNNPTFVEVEFVLPYGF